MIWDDEQKMLMFTFYNDRVATAVKAEDLLVEIGVFLTFITLIQYKHIPKINGEYPLICSKKDMNIFMDFLKRNPSLRGVNNERDI